MLDRPINILLVEDSPEDAELLLWHLKKNDIEASWERVDTPEEMIAALERESWDVIVSDYIMPGFSGLEALELLKSRSEDIPFIIVSGKVGEETAVEAMKAGAHDYILKGNLVRLAPAIQRELAESEMRRQRNYAEKELRTLKHAIETIPVGVTITDIEGKIIFTNQAEAEMHGYTVNELLGCDARIFSVPEHRKVWKKEDIKKFVCMRRETLNVRKNGDTFPVYLISSVVLDQSGEPVAIITACEDITERKKSEERLRYMSTHDTLTGFYNRAFFEEELKRLAEQRFAPVSVIMLDVDGLKQVNDTLGHAAGDKVLKQTASVLFSVFRSEDIVARIGGDEFVVILPGAEHHVAEKAMNRIRDVINQSTCSFGGLELSLSIGAATTDNPEGLEDAIKLADERMYQDKLTKSSRTLRSSLNDRRLSER
ncbi:putative diguanylate cyclase YegE [Geobacter sp. OR-1]|uniref:GGDEF domain-containing response regulator n=1 Tax=Geobacter sp. OR-1 TaxID=1266765 RepID=UPI000541D1B3|nr:diguanylate cyclase [Geobacter sp. OR-1]GAM09845.1 putative diguanylate cyclase YegE [Geobacter sp. OR-1]